MNNAGITSIAVGFPKQVRDNAWFVEHHPDIFAAMEQRSLSQVFRSDGGTAATRGFDEAMQRFLADPFRGTVHRRWLAPDQSQVDLEADVAREAIRKARLDVEDIDQILVAAFPTAHTGIGDGVYLARALGTRRPAFNVETACSGGLASLQLASALVQSGQAKHVLVVVSCIYSRASDSADTLSWFLGDGVGAYVVSAVDDASGFQAFHAINTAESCGSFSYQLEVEDGAARAVIRAGEEAGKALRDMTPRAIRDVCTAAAKRAGVALHDVDFFVPNTPLAWFADLFAATLQIPRDKTISTYDEYANMGPALNPVNLHRALARGLIRPGDTVMLFSIGSVSTAAATVLRVGDVGVGEVVER